ncbi:MAG: AAA family ATPase [Gammaproteobacteria bacterium]
MLKSIFIKNFAIIDTLELDFHDGMSVLTGETGAGKSIIIDALNLAIGNRADRSIARIENKNV